MCALVGMLLLTLVSCDPSPEDAMDDMDGAPGAEAGGPRADDVEDAAAHEADAGEESEDAGPDATLMLDAAPEAQADAAPSAAEAGLSDSMDMDSRSVEPDAQGADADATGPGDADANALADAQDASADAWVEPVVLPPMPVCPSPTSSANVLTGTIVVDGPQRLDQLRMVTRIEGDLLINPARVSRVELSMLEQVTGRIGFTFSYTTTVPDPSKPWETVMVRDSDQLTDIVLPALRSANSIQAVDVHGLRGLQLPCLTTVGQDIKAWASIRYGVTAPLEQLQTLDMRSLTSARDVIIHANSELALLAAQDFGGSLCPTLSKLLAPTLTRIRGRFCAQNAQYIPSLAEVDELVGCPNPSAPLTRARQVTLAMTCSYDRLRSVDGMTYKYLRIAGNLLLSGLTVNVVPEPSPGVATVTIGGLTAADEISGVANYGLIVLPDLKQAGKLIFEVPFGDNSLVPPTYRTLRLPALESVGALTLEGAGLTPIVELPKLRQVGNLHMYTSQAHVSEVPTDQAFPALESAGTVRTCDVTTVGPGGTCRLGALAFPHLRQADALRLRGWGGGSVPPASLPELTTLGTGPHELNFAGVVALDKLTSVAGDFIVRGAFHFRAPLLAQLTTLALTLHDGQTTSFGAPLQASAITINSVGAAAPICGQCRALIDQLAQPQSTSLICQTGTTEWALGACP